MVYLLVRLMCALMTVQSLLASGLAVVDLQEEKKVYAVADDYLQEHLSMDPSVKSRTVVKDFAGWVNRRKSTYVSESFRLLGKFKASEVWLVRYVNDDDGRLKVGNGAGRAALIVDVKLLKVVGVWLMPK